MWHVQMTVQVPKCPILQTTRVSAGAENFTQQIELLL